MQEINKKFLKNSHYITDLKLCTVRLINNNKFPWIILIPRRSSITDMTELSTKDQLLLMKEIIHCSKLIKKIFRTSKLNIEKIGNVVPQLHIHIIARFKNDSTWPLSVWVIKGNPYTKKTLTTTIDKIKKAFL